MYGGIEYDRYIIMYRYIIMLMPYALIPLHI